MKTIIKYQAQDGMEFEHEEDCLRYEASGCVELFPLPGYGDHTPRTERNLEWMLRGDGSCYYATSNLFSRIRPHSEPHPVWATHLIYFGK